MEPCTRKVRCGKRFNAQCWQQYGEQYVEQYVVRGAETPGSFQSSGSEKAVILEKRGRIRMLSHIPHRWVLATVPLSSTGSRVFTADLV